MPKLCLPHVALTLRQQHKRLCWYFFVFYDCLPQLFRHRYWRRRSAACGCNFDCYCDCSRETRTVKLWLPTVEVTRTATGWRCCCCLYGFCTSFILEGGLAPVPIAVAVASQLTLANGNGVNVATVAAATVPATTPATATVAATAAANERELNLGDLTLSIYLGHGCCLLSCVRCRGSWEEGGGDYLSQRKCIGSHYRFSCHFYGQVMGIKRARLWLKFHQSLKYILNACRCVCVSECM